VEEEEEEEEEEVWYSLDQVPTTSHLVINIRKSNKFELCCLFPKNTNVSLVRHNFGTTRSVFKRVQDKFTSKFYVTGCTEPCTTGCTNVEITFLNSDGPFYSCSTTVCGSTTP
jgi:hypothetical protein